MKKLCLFVLALLSLLFVSAQDCSNDTTNPWFVNFQDEVTISCSDDLSSVFPIAQDDCDTLVEIAYYEEPMGSYCPNSRDFMRIYRAFDDFGNGVVAQQFVHIVDETPPMFFYVPPSYVIECSDTLSFEDFPQPSALDNCGGVSITHEDYFDITDGCYSSKTRVWTATDLCGNSSTASQMLLIQDMTPPVITGLPYVTLPSGSGTDTLLVVVIDACNTFNVYYIDTPASGNNLIRNYTAIDACGNTSTFEQIIGFEIVTPPGDDDDEDDDDEDDDDDDEDDDEDDDDEDDDNGNNVAICHRIGNGNFITIYVAPAAVQAHLNHGDYLGPCQNLNIHNPNLPMQMDIEIKPNGKIKKTVKAK